MPWANLDDNFAEHGKNVTLSDAAWRLHVSGILYCARLCTDGVIAAEKVPGLAPRYRQRTLEELLSRGHWVAHGDVYEIRDYLQWNRSKATIEAARERKSAGGRRGAQRRWDPDDVA